MSTGLRRKTSRQSHWKIAVTAMGFFLAMFFFRFPVSFFGLVQPVFLVVKVCVFEIYSNTNAVSILVEPMMRDEVLPSTSL